MSSEYESLSVPLLFFESQRLSVTDVSRLKLFSVSWTLAPYFNVTFLFVEAAFFDSLLNSTILEIASLFYDMEVGF